MVKKLRAIPRLSSNIKLTVSDYAMLLRAVLLIITNNITKPWWSVGCIITGSNSISQQTVAIVTYNTAVLIATSL